MKREPVMRRIRADRRATSPLRDPVQRNFLVAGLILLIFLGSLPFMQVDWSLGAERLATIAALFFLIAAGGQAFGLGARSFLVSAVAVSLLYLLTAWTRFIFEFDDFFIIAVLVSFLVFVMAGFYLTLVLEDGVAWLQDRTSPDNTRGSLVVLIVSAVLMGTLPLVGAYWIWFKWIWVTSIIGTVLLGSWWVIHVKRKLHPDPVLHDLDLLVIGALAAVGMAELVSRIGDETHLLPGIVAYISLLATWLYLSYVTVRRTQALLKHNDPGPWLSILFAAAFSIVAHAERRFRFDFDYAADSLLSQRVLYLLIGIWLGISFFATRASWTILQHVRDTGGISARSRKVARAAARVTEEILETEGKLEGVAQAFFVRIDAVIGRKKTKDKRKRLR